MKLWLQKDGRVVLKSTRAERTALKKRLGRLQECQSHSPFDIVQADVLGVLSRHGKVELTRLPGVHWVTLSQVLTVLVPECKIKAPESRIIEAHKRIIAAGQ